MTILAIGDALALVAPPATSPDVPLDLALTQAGDFVMTPYGDLATVHGAARCMQDLWMLAVTPQGTLLGDPGYGDIFARQVGEPAMTPALAQSRASGLARQIGQLHDLRVAAGYAPGLGEQIASVSVDAVNLSGTSATVDLIVHTQTGPPERTTLPVAGANQIG